MAKSNGTTTSDVVTKSVKLPLTVTVTGSKENLTKGKIEDLTEKLRTQLPFVVRMGRGHKEIIAVQTK